MTPWARLRKFLRRRGGVTGSQRGAQGDAPERGCSVPRLKWLQGLLLTVVLILASVVTALPAHADFISANSTLKNDGILPMIKVFEKLDHGCWGEGAAPPDKVKPGRR